MKSDNPCASGALVLEVQITIRRMIKMEWRFIRATTMGICNKVQGLVEVTSYCVIRVGICIYLKYACVCR